MILDKRSLAVIGDAADEPGRYAIHCMAVEPDGTAVAMDGRSMVAVQGLTDAAGPDKRTLLTPSEVKTAVKSMAGGKKGYTQHVHVEVSLAGSELSIRGPKKCVTVPNYRPEEGAFPGWQDMMPPRKASDRTVFLSASALRKLASVLDTLSGDDPQTVELTIPAAPMKAVTFRGKVGGDTERQFLAVLAPVLVKPDNPRGDMHRNAWADELQPPPGKAKPGKK